jgi:hypothetical protein
MNTHSWKTRALAIGLAGTTAIAVACSASAAPVLTGTATLKQALPNDVQDVRWGWGGGAFFGGLVAGGLIGAAISRPYYGYGYGYGYGYPAYGYGYGYAPYSYPYAYSYPSYSYSYGYPYGGYYGGYYGGWRGGYGGWRGGYGGWRGAAWRGAHVRHR